MKKILCKKINLFFSQDRGSIAVVTTLLIVILFGFAGLAIDVGIWYSQKRQLQLAADAGAAGGVFALGITGQSTVTAYATYDASLNGCTTANNCTITAVNTPPSSGPYAGNNSAVEVILQKPAELFFAGFFLSSAPVINVRGVATLQASSNICYGSLGTNGITMVGTSNLSAPNCSVYSGNNITLSGNPGIVADKVYSVGTINDPSKVHTSAGGTIQNAPALIDLYANLAVPSYSGCTYTNYSGSPAALSPGVFCGGVKITGGVITMSPGTYIIDGGNFSLSGGTVINGTGVTLVFTSSAGTNYPNIDITGGVILNLSAPTSGTFNNVLMYEDRNATPTPSVKIAGNTGSALTGLLYFPSADVTLTGVSTTLSTACLRAIGKSLTINGTSSTNSGPTCTAAQSPLGVAALVE